MTEAGASIGRLAAGFARVAWRALVVILAGAILLEIALRLRGYLPQDLYRVGLSPAVLDRWTETAMRPDMHVNEYAVTNFFGLHEDRQINLEKTPGLPRVAVLGSSVAWGLYSPLERTIPRLVQHELEGAGCPAEVLNFGNQGFNILNATAYIETKMHQFHPDAVVVMMDLQMGVPRFPRPNPFADEQVLIRKLGFFEEAWKRATEYSVALTAIDDVRWSRAVLGLALPFRTEPAATARPGDAAPEPADAGRKLFAETWQRAVHAAAAMFEPLKRQYQPVTMTPARPVPAAQPERTVPEYENRRKRELGALVATASTFASQMGMPLYFVTPYGPYFHATEAEAARFSPYIMDEARLYGSRIALVRREAELQSETIALAAGSHGAKVIDMLPASREARMSSGDFNMDGIHLTPDGNRRIAKMIAARLQGDGLCGATAPRR